MGEEIREMGGERREMGGGGVRERKEAGNIHVQYRE